MDIILFVDEYAIKSRTHKKNRVSFFFVLRAKMDKLSFKRQFPLGEGPIQTLQKDNLPLPVEYQKILDYLQTKVATSHRPVGRRLHPYTVCKGTHPGELHVQGVSDRGATATYSEALLFIAYGQEDPAEWTPQAYAVSKTWTVYVLIGYPISEEELHAKHLVCKELAAVRAARLKK